MIEVSPHQYAVCALLAEALSNKEMAYRLGITEGTVKVYLSRIYEDFPVRGSNMRTVVALAFQKGWITKGRGRGWNGGPHRRSPGDVPADANGPRERRNRANEAWVDAFQAEFAAERPAADMRIGSTLGKKI